MRSIVLALLFVTGLISTGRAEEVLRDVNGRRLGTITQEGSRSVFRDANGAAKSYWQQEGDAQVHCKMDSTRLGTTSKH
jgi:hypothetical protein